MSDDRLMAIAEALLKIVYLPGVMVAIASLVYAIITGRVNVNNW